MNSILEKYKSKSNDVIAQIKQKVNSSDNMKDTLENIREELSSWGKENINLLTSELKEYINKNNPDFIAKNKDKWEMILDKAQALSEYGLYVAPIDLLTNNEDVAKATYVGVASFLSSILLTKIVTKKVHFVASVLTSVASGFVAYYMLETKKGDEKDLIMNYIDDAHEWINTAFENTYKTFQNAL